MARGRRKSVSWHVLDRTDLSGFDDVSTAAIQYAMQHGGVGRISRKGHAILRSPNGRTMSVAARSNRSQQVINLTVRKLFGDNGNDNGTTQQKEEQVSTKQEPTDVVFTKPAFECTVKTCTQVFHNEDALHEHLMAAHHVCPEPGCWWASDTTRGISGHNNIVHKGIVPRRIAKERGATVDSRGRALAHSVTDPLHVPLPNGGTLTTMTVPSKPKPEPKPPKEDRRAQRGFGSMDPELRREYARQGALKAAESRRAAKAAREAAAAAEKQEQPVTDDELDRRARRAQVLADKVPEPTKSTPETVRRAQESAREAAEPIAQQVLTDVHDVLGEHLASLLRRLDKAIAHFEAPPQLGALVLLSEWVSDERHALVEQIENRDKRIAELEATVGDLHTKLHLIRESLEA